MMATLPNALDYAIQCHSDRRKLKEQQFNPVSARLPPPQPADVCQPAHRGLECEVISRTGKPIKFIEKYSGSGDLRGGRIQGGQPCRDQVRIHEVQHARLVRQELLCEGGLARPVRTCNHDATRLALGHGWQRCVLK